FGADALRLALVMGVAPASDIAISDEKVLGGRNFANKVWNISRFINMKLDEAGIKSYGDLPSFKKNIKGLNISDKKIINKLVVTTKAVTDNIEKYKFGLAAEKLYAFIWHDFADSYIESTKERLSSGDNTPLSVLRYILFTSLKLLHPFMPFVTEAIWQEMKHQRMYPKKMLIESKWPGTGN
ncbi:MAG: Valine-tRNA ligase, partial [Candidatus Woesebacteria bacterium GW2011_GWB1_38_5]